ncbi:hypothetical protein N0V91_004752 [Didymella pomorum]|uniref:Uncharacterized protein n=1 Tax=Didymella pomorum TaxID=749634 RepID=A0A9W8ZGI3_9PLEO|nr:hypothetical protein N0V91_004752 [Didymella pomorum]
MEESLPHLPRCVVPRGHSHESSESTIPSSAGNPKRQKSDPLRAIRGSNSEERTSFLQQVRETLQIADEMTDAGQPLEEIQQRLKEQLYGQ